MMHDFHAFKISGKAHWDVTETKNWERGMENGELVTSTREGKMKKSNTNTNTNTKIEKKIES